MPSTNDRLHAVDPRRRVDRSLYPKDADMPEFPGAVLLNHVGLRSAQVASAAGIFVVSPLLWMRSGFKTPIFSQLIPKVAGRLFVLGYFGGACSVVAMAVADKSPSKKGQPLTIEGVDDRAFRIVHNTKVQQIADFSSAGMAGAAVAGRAGFLGNLAVGSVAGLGAFAFANIAMPKIRKEFWPHYKPELAAFLKSAGIDTDSLTTGGSPAPAKKK